MRSKLSEGSIIYEHICFPFAVGEFGYNDGCSVLQVHPGRMLFVEYARGTLKSFCYVLFINILNNLRILAVLQVHLGTSSRRDCS